MHRPAAGAAAHGHQQRQPGSLAAAWRLPLGQPGMAVALWLWVACGSVALWLWPVAQGAKRSSGRAKVKF